MTSSHMQLPLLRLIVVNLVWCSADDSEQQPTPTPTTTVGVPPCAKPDAFNNVTQWPKMQYRASWKCRSCIHGNAKSQHGEDQKLLPLLHQVSEATEGTFVELGALDGVSMSNSYLFEKCFGWRGVLIEANGDNFAKMQKANRNRSHLVHSAICNGTGTVRFTKGGNNVAAQVDVMDPKHWKRWGKVIGTRVDEVSCRSLASILADNGMPRPTFLSLDVEGAEAIVLRTVDPSAFEVILIEWAGSGQESEKDREVHQLLSQAGMLLREALSKGNSWHGGLSRVYVKPTWLSSA